MRKYKVLCLTDHSKHSTENSVYALMRSMSEHPQCAFADIASRGSEKNKAFFEDRSTTKVWAKKVDTYFQFDPTKKQFDKDTKWIDLKEYDIVFMRLPRPISDDFLNWIEELTPNRVVVNRPSGIIKTSNKAFLLDIPEVCPPIRLCHSIDEIMDFYKQFPIVLKPLREYGGKGILKIKEGVLDDGKELYPIESFLESIQSTIETEGYLAMKYLQNVHKGDKRIIVVGGEIMAASLRLPAEGSWLCNVAQGGQSILAEVTEEEQEIIETINPILKQEGIVIYGADTLEGDDGKRVLSEINTLSIGGFPQAEIQTGRPLIVQTLNKLFSYADNQ